MSCSFLLSTPYLDLNCPVSSKTPLMVVIVFSALISLSLVMQKHSIIVNEKGQTYKTPLYIELKLI